MQGGPWGHSIREGRGRRERGGWGGEHWVWKWGFTWTFPENQDVTVKFKSELIFINFLYVFNVIGNTEPICFTQTIPSMCEP